MHGQPLRELEVMVIDNTAHFDRAEKLARDPERVRRDFWLKFKRVAVKLPFAEDLLAAYYCAFDRETPRQVQAAILAALAYFVLPTDAIPDVLAVVGFTDDAAVFAALLAVVGRHLKPKHKAEAMEVLERMKRQDD